MRRAVIDVGTNSVKLLVAEVAGGEVIPVLEESEQTRLGRGFYEASILQPEAIAQTATAVSIFARKAQELGAKVPRIIATSAARDAKNPADLISAIEQKSGLKLEIISGEQEADWAFQGVTTHRELAVTPLLIIDVGGGSTEFILGDQGQKYFRHSFDIGTVRLLEKLPPSDPPTAAELEKGRAWLKTFIDENIFPRLSPALKRFTTGQIQLVGTGGTSTLMARIDQKLDGYDREVIEATRVSATSVQAMTQRLWELPLAQRQEIVGLPKNRADVMLFGVLIFQAIMEKLEFSELRVSTRGLRYAAVSQEAHF